MIYFQLVGKDNTHFYTEKGIKEIKVAIDKSNDVLLQHWTSSLAFLQPSNCPNPWALKSLPSV